MYRKFSYGDGLESVASIGVGVRRLGRRTVRPP
jgi:hypothetical protein